jgi:hypothetical protein
MVDMGNNREVPDILLLGHNVLGSKDMMKRFSCTAAFLLIALFSSVYAAKAQEPATTPREIQGHWALPDCGEYDEAVVFSHYFYLKSTAADQTLLPATLWRKQGDYWILGLDGKAAPVQLQDDGILKEAVLSKPPAGSLARWPQSWDDLSIDSTIEYAGCTETPTVIPAVMVRLMRFIDRIAEQCTARIDNDCARVLFKFADSDNDKKLNRAEIRSAATAMFLFGDLAAQKTLTAEQSRKILEDARPETKKIADDIMAAHDKDRSGTLDFNELVENFTPPQEASVYDVLEKAGTLLPPLKIAALALRNNAK